uniref:2-C-methyl-D-erythritol 2,4-cyclodiphosphate synthase n=1 Tax=Haemonchus placei TaxID=6290 RepID=A0A0N4WV18_HAEPC
LASDFVDHTKCATVTFSAIRTDHTIRCCTCAIVHAVTD